MKNIHLVFDLDGTLADTQIIHQKIESDFLKTVGFVIEPEEIGKKYAGRSPQEWIPEVLRKNNIDFKQEDINNFVHSKDNQINKLLIKGEIKLMPNVKNMLENLYEKGYKIGISSGSCREIINNFIKYFDFETVIQASTSANEVEHKKPAPDVFIKSFEHLEEQFGKPDLKFVVGDGKSDVLGGTGAGAKIVFYTNGLPNSFWKEIEDKILFKIDNFVELPSIIDSFNS